MNQAAEIARTGLMSFLLITGLASCTPIPPSAPLPPVNKEEQASSLTHLNHWQITAKIGVQTARDSGSASVDWLQKGAQFRLSLQGPLGSGNLKLWGSNTQVTLQTADGKTYTAATPEQLLAKQWGFKVPISNMRYWIRGLAVPQVAAQTQWDADGRLSELRQQGWHIQYLGYTRVGAIALPERMSLTSNGLRVKIVVHQWRLDGL